MTSFSLFLLGSPRVERDGVAMPLERRKALALLGYLAVTGECQRRETLATLFWPEAETGEARAALRRTLSVLNTALSGLGLDVQRDCVAIRADAVWTDVVAFRGRLAELNAQRIPVAEPSTAASVAMEGLTEVVSLYRGDFLAGFTLRDSPGFDDWQFQQTESLQRELAWALEQLTSGLAAQGDYRAALEPARRWVALDQLHEPAQRRLMKLYAWAGQPAAALRLYQECARLLEREVGAAPEPETTRLYEAIRAGHLTPPVPSATPPPIRLPGDLTVETAPPRPSRPPRLPAQTTPLLGRVGELGRMADRLADRNCRLLTVLGPGGSGKTRLALQAAASYSARTEQPVYFVPLAAAPAPEMLAGAIAEALGLSFYEHADNAGPLLDILRDQALLLLLDNFEHLLPAAGLLADILAQAPGIKVVVTSRERLQLHGEWVMELSGLPYPASADVPNSDFYDAVQLFVTTARRARADFSIDDASRPAIVEICRLVEGMPLGIELAAPWVRMLSVQEIAAEITRNLDFLATTRRDVPARHRSLRAAFEHSWNLLADSERQALQRLSVFRGGFLRTAGLDVAGASLPVLAALADKSLLRSLPPRHAEAQFELHDLVRQFAAEKLHANPDEAAQTERKHSRFYSDLLAQKSPYMAECSDWSDELFDEIATDLENVRAAWRWAATHGDLEIIEVAFDGLCKFYQRQSWFQEGSEVFGLATARLEEVATGEGGERYLPLLAELLARRGMFNAYLGQHDLARQQLRRSLELLRAHGDPARLGQALMRAGVVIREFGDYTEAQALLQETLAVARESKDEDLITHTLSYLGYLLGEIGEFDAAARALSEALERSRQTGDVKNLASALNNFGFVCYLAGDLARALAMTEESLQYRRSGKGYGLAIGLDNLGYIRAARGEIAAATAHFDEALRMAQVRHAVPLANDVILGLAMLLPLPDQAPRAVELMTFVLQHPLTWRETKDRAERWLAERACLLAPEGVAAAQARAHASTYEEVVGTLLPAGV